MLIYKQYDVVNLIFQIQTALAVIYGRVLSPLLDSYGYG